MCLGQKETGRTIVKPASFKTQEFRSIVLDNAIEFLLVSDAELDKAGASIDVRILLFRLLQRIVTSSPKARARLFDMNYLELDNMQSSMPSDLHMRSCLCASGTRGKLVRSQRHPRPRSFLRAHALLCLSKVSRRGCIQQICGKPCFWHHNRFIGLSTFSRRSTAASSMPQSIEQRNLLSEPCIDKAPYASMPQPSRA